MWGIIKITIIWFRGDGSDRGLKEEVTSGLSLKEWGGVSEAESGVRRLQREEIGQRHGVATEYDGISTSQRWPWATLRIRKWRQRWNRKVVCGLTVMSLTCPPRVSILSLQAGRATECPHRGLAWKAPAGVWGRTRASRPEAVASAQRTPWGSGRGRPRGLT